MMSVKDTSVSNVDIKVEEDSNDSVYENLADDMIDIQYEEIVHTTNENPIIRTSAEKFKTNENNYVKSEKVAYVLLHSIEKTLKKEKDSEDVNTKEYKNSDKTINVNETLTSKSIFKNNMKDPKLWLRIRMTEEEAMQDFRTRADEGRYVRAAHKCDKCFRIFTKEEKLSKHINMYHNKNFRTKQCNFCQMKFRNKKILAKHMSTHYIKFKCLRCHLVFHFENSAIRHNEIHSGVERICQYCGLKFKHISSYYSHVRIFHRSEHVCTICGVACISAKGVRQHRAIKHGGVDPNADEGETSYNCERCDIKFKTKQAYDEHFKQSAKHADISDTTTEKGQIENQPNEGHANLLLKAEIKRQALRNREPRETTCFVCKKTFPSYFRYKKHHRSEHKGIPMPTAARKTCNICGQVIKTTTITRHMNIHTQQEAYPCDVCGTHFYHQSSLVRHQATHKEEKAFTCPVCHKGFTQKGSMQLHHRAKHLHIPYPKRKKTKTDNGSTV